MFRKVMELLRGQRATSGLRSAEEFRRVLDHERNCVHRNGHCFCLVVFELQNDADATARDLRRVFDERLRSTDVSGWLDGQHIGVILPYTSDEGAEIVIRDISASLGRTLPVACYRYPSDDFDDQGGDGETRVPEVVVVPGVPQASITRARPGVGAVLHPSVPWWKRSMDVCGAGFGLLLFAPVMVGTAIAVRATSKGPIFFGQKRSGQHGAPFTCYKFRSMYDGAVVKRNDLLEQNEQTGPVFKMRNDPRITPLGRLLRKTSIDELPQLWNVLRGDMSLVGPRPLPCHENESCEQWQRDRLAVRPGLTCTWQVKGRMEIKFEEWVRMDIQYVRSVSLLQDLKLLALTGPAVLSGRGAC